MRKSEKQRKKLEIRRKDYEVTVERLGRSASYREGSYTRPGSNKK